MTQEEKTSRTRERILTAAIEEFGTKGYTAATVGEICGEHNITKGLLYHNFASKEELYLACVSRCFEQVTNYLQGQESGAELQRYMERRFQFFSAYPLYARIFFEAVLQPPEKLKAAIQERKKEFDAFNRTVYRNALENLTLREGVTEQDALDYYEIMQEMFNGYFSSSAYAGKDLQFLGSEHESRLAKILDLMLYGIVERGDHS